jgi:hypothetical protein
MKLSKRRTVIALYTLGMASLAAYSSPNVRPYLIPSTNIPSSHSAPSPAPVAQGPSVSPAVETAYAGQSAHANDAANLPETVYAGQRQPYRAGMPETVYAGEEPSAMAAAGLPETVYAGRHNQAAANGLPETVYADISEPAAAAQPVNEALAQAPAAEAAAAQHRYGVGQGPRQQHPGPYAHFTQAERPGVNPCENKKAPSPYTSQTDAQRAAETNCW